jgi:protein-L-isoaspartate(D-aspartate) O-methyltransferase
MRYTVASHCGAACGSRVDRRQLLLGVAGVVAAGAMTWPAHAAVPVPYSFDATPPSEDRAAFIEWMAKHRGEAANFTGMRWDRYQALLRRKDIWEKRNIRAFLMTPREEFIPAAYHARAYEGIFVNIGWGVTITDPHAVARMTNAMDVRMGDKVLEVGTGSGYQSAYLTHLTDKVWSVEIIKPLAERTRKLYDGLIEKGYTEYQAINTKNADGYYGWESEAPFDRIIVTCGIDHVPPPLMQQLKPNGVMMIPIGPPGAQNVLKIVKTQQADGSISVTRTDIYNGGKLVWVPFFKLDGEQVKGRYQR